MPDIRAIIFDFDGLLLDTEPLHYEGFKQALAARYPIELGQADYYQRYVGFDDRDGFKAMLADYGYTKQSNDVVVIEQLMHLKAGYFEQALRQNRPAKPGAIDFVHAAKKNGLRTAVCSGALAKEVNLGLALLGIASQIETVVSANDVSHSKPDPASYRLSVERLNQLLPGQLLLPEQCLALEDTTAGLRSAKGAGLWAIAVEGTEPVDKLAQHADFVISSLLLYQPEQLIAQLVIK